MGDWGTYVRTSQTETNTAPHQGLPIAASGGQIRRRMAWVSTIIQTTPPLTLLSSVKFFPTATRVTALWLMRVKNRSADVIGHNFSNILPNQPQSLQLGFKFLAPGDGHCMYKIGF
jgi:hypothetical protein